MKNGPALARGRLSVRNLAPPGALSSDCDCAIYVVALVCSMRTAQLPHMFADLRAADVLAAARRLHGIIRQTPLVRSQPLSTLAGGDVWLKLENQQITGSFKLRGAYNALATLDAETRGRGIVASSAGNHGLGVAWAAKALGITATIFVPSTAPRVKRDGIAALGATVDDTQPHYDAAMDAAKAHAVAHGKAYINPCLGDMLLAGQGTVALEILAELPSVRTLVVPVGGAGLLGGTASLVRRVAPDVHIVGAQSERTRAMSTSLEAGRVTGVPVEPTLADGLAGQIDEEAFDIGRNGLDAMVQVSEDDIADSIVWFASTHGARVEGAGAVGVAAIRSNALTSELRFPAAVIVSGGNIDEDRLRSLRETRNE
jgi:threonine dehydratase